MSVSGITDFTVKYDTEMKLKDKHRQLRKVNHAGQHGRTVSSLQVYPPVTHGVHANEPDLDLTLKNGWVI
jgi:hypothetical protein